MGLGARYVTLKHLSLNQNPNVLNWFYSPQNLEEWHAKEARELEEDMSTQYEVSKVQSGSLIQRNLRSAIWFSGLATLTMEHKRKGIFTRIVSHIRNIFCGGTRN